eukprot:4695566-Alexandrium_andersonii.AAC.1
MLRSLDITVRELRQDRAQWATIVVPHEAMPRQAARVGLLACSRRGSLAGSPPGQNPCPGDSSSRSVLRTGTPCAS